MVELFKRFLILAGNVLLRYIEGGRLTGRLRRKCRMAHLRRRDILQWRAEMAREMGVRVGRNCRFYSLNFFSEPYLVEIGDNVIISGEVKFVTHDGAVYLWRNEEPSLFGNFGRIRIGNNCFIGMGAIILQNVEIGDNSIVCAGAVVMDSFPENSVIMGSPAKLLFNTTMYKKMRLRSRWTVSSAEWAFPKNVPEAKRREILEKHFAELPPKKPRRGVFGKQSR